MIVLDRAGRTGDRGVIGILVAIALATALRVTLAAGNPATSLPASIAFVAALACIAVAYRAAPPTFTWQSMIVGLGGAAVLVWFAFMQLPGRRLLIVHPQPPLLSWSLAVCAIAAAEELVFRGVLFEHMARSVGASLTVILTAAAFAFVHVPLYGWRVVPLDVAVGIWLGVVRLWGGVASSATAHALADLASGWLLL